VDTIIVFYLYLVNCFHKLKYHLSYYADISLLYDYQYRPQKVYYTLDHMSDRTEDLVDK